MQSEQKTIFLPTPRQQKTPLSNMIRMLLLLAAIQLTAWILPSWPEFTGIPYYLPLHNLLEMISIVISMMVCAIGWNSRSQNLSGNVILLACVFFCVGLLDFLHSVSYVGMPDYFSHNDAQKHLYFWLAGRLLAALVLLGIVVRPWKPLKWFSARYLTLGIMLGLILLLNWVVITHQSWLPDMFIPGQGLTALKKSIEYIIIIINVFTALLLWKKLRTHQTQTNIFLFGAISTLAMSEFYFTLYSTMTGSYNVLGHIYKVIAYLMIYRAIVIEIIDEPYQQLSKFKDIIDSSEDAIMSLSLGNIIQSWNKGAERMFGYSAAEAIGAPIQMLIPADDVAQQLHFFDQIHHGSLIRQYEATRHKKDGQLIHIATSISPILDEQYKIIGIAKIDRDISQRKKNDWRLVQMNLALNCVREAAFLMNQDGNFLYVNDEACRILEYSREELLNGMGASQIDPEWSRERLSDYWNELKHHGSRMIESIHVTSSGRAFPVEISTNYFEFEGQGYNMALVRDISVRKQAENDIRIAATAFESQEGMTINDQDGLIIKVNKAFSRITGYSTEEVTGKNPRLLKSGRHDRQFYAAMWHSILTTGAWEGEIWNRRKNGEIYPEHLTITAVKNEHGVVTNYVATLTDITHTKAAEDEIRHLAFYDPLTQLPNRRLLHDRLKQALSATSRNGLTGAVLFIDLDNFKTLNDSLGHDIGDILLEQVALRLKSCIREEDTVARLGGDEFVVMIEGMSKNTMDAAEQTKTVGNKILNELNQIYQLGKYPYHNTPSIGVTLFSDNKQSIDDVLKQADLAMYQSKKMGRNTLSFFDPHMQEVINARSKIDRDLHIALEQQQFELYYQVQMQQRGQFGMFHPIGAEALIRWNHPERGLVPPIDFIPLAEESGLIIPIGEWVLESACAQIKLWERDAKTRHWVLAVNISARQFRQPQFVEQVHAIIDKHAINPTLLKLELTESLLLEDVENTISTMQQLKQLGVKFSLDDFGTGYSSLQYLKQLPLDQLKIDQSFVRDLVTDNTDRAIVSTIITMACNLNLNHIAEGVETKAQQQLLLSMGCHHHQGYLYGKPIRIAQFEATYIALR